GFHVTGVQSCALPICLLFAQLAALRHVIVLNDPGHLTDAANKTYFQHFPERVRPVTCITLDADEIRAFITERKGYGVIKPLQGSDRKSVCREREKIPW